MENKEKAYCYEGVMDPTYFRVDVYHAKNESEINSLCMQWLQEYYERNEDETIYKLLQICQKLGSIHKKFNEIDELMKWIKASPDKEYGFLCIGEKHDDIE